MINNTRQPIEYVDSEEEQSNQEQIESEIDCSSSSDEVLDPDNTYDIRNISIKQVNKDGYSGIGSYGNFEVYNYDEE